MERTRKIQISIGIGGILAIFIIIIVIMWLYNQETKQSINSEPQHDNNNLNPLSSSHEESTSAAGGGGDDQVNSEGSQSRKPPVSISVKNKVKDENNHQDNPNSVVVKNQPEESKLSGRENNKTGNDNNNAKQISLVKPSVVSKTPIEVFLQDAQLLISKLEAKANSKSKKQLQNMRNCIKSSPHTPPSEYIFLDLSHEAKALTEKKDVFETFSDIVDKQSHLEKASKFQVTLVETFQKKEFFLEKAESLSAKIASKHIKDFSMPEAIEEMAKITDKKELAVIIEYFEAKLQHFQVREQYYNMCNDNIYMEKGIRESGKETMQTYIDSAQEIILASKLLQMQDAFPSDPQYAALKDSNFKYSTELVEKLLADPTEKYEALLTVLEEFYKYSSQSSYKLFMFIKATHSLSKQPLLKASVEMFSSESRPVAGSEDSQNQRTVDTFIKALRGIDIKVHLESVQVVFDHFFHYCASNPFPHHQIAMLKYARDCSEYGVLKATLEDILEKILAAGVSFSLSDLLVLVDKFLERKLDPRLPIFLYHFSQATAFRFVKVNPDILNLFRNVALYADLKLQLDLNYSDSLANRLRAEYPTEFSTVIKMKSYPRSSNPQLRRYYAFKRALEGINDGEPNFTASIWNIWNFVLFPFVQEKIEYHRDASNADSIACRFNALSKTLSVSKCIEGKMLSSSADVEEAVECIVKSVKEGGDQEALLDLIMQLHTVDRLATQRNYFSLQVLGEQMVEEKTLQEMRTRYIRAVREEFPVFNALMNYKNPSNIEEIVLEEPLRLNPDFLKDLPEMAKKFWNEKFFPILNQEFIKEWFKKYKSSTRALSEAAEVLHFSISYVLRGFHGTKDSQKQYSYYLEAAFIFSKSFAKEPFDLDQIQTDIVKGKAEDHRALAYLI